MKLIFDCAARIFQKKAKISIDKNAKAGILCPASGATRLPDNGNAPVAQLDRASDYGSEGLGFESLRACYLTGSLLVRLFSGGVPVSTEHSRRRLHVEVDRLASLKAAQKIKCLFR